jgi:hypothetical protein
MIALELFGFLTPCPFDNELVGCITPIVSLGELVVLIWGSVVVAALFLVLFKKVLTRHGLKKMSKNQSTAITLRSCLHLCNSF